MNGFAIFSEVGKEGGEEKENLLNQSFRISFFSLLSLLLLWFFFYKPFNGILMSFNVIFNPNLLPSPRGRLSISGFKRVLRELTARTRMRNIVQMWLLHNLLFSICSFIFLFGTNAIKLILTKNFHSCWFRHHRHVRFNFLMFTPFAWRRTPSSSSSSVHRRRDF